MTRPAHYNLTIYKGESFYHAFTFKNRRTKELIDLSGYAPKAQIRPTKNNPVLSKEFTLSIVGGTVVMRMSAADTAELDPGVEAWDLKLSDAGSVKYWIEGEVIINGRVTE